jgi:hypothetical protein
VTTRGRQYPDSPLVPDPDVIYRPLQQPAWPSSGTPEQFWPDGAGEVLHNILGGSEPEPGPPYTHTIVPPEPAGWDEDGNPVDPEPGPAFTVSDGAAVSERYSPSREAEAFGRTLSASLAAGIEEGSRRAALGLPPEPLSPATEVWLERAVKRSWWALYEDGEP